jgi:cobalt-zinc-cadmium efflux system outer membrane protein
MPIRVPRKTTTRSTWLGCRRRRWRALAIAVVLCRPAFGQDVAAGTLRAGVLQVCARGPDRAAATALLEHGRASRVVARAGDNPALLVQHADIVEGPLDRETVIGLQVPVVLSGRRGLLREAAEARWREARFRSADVLLRAALEVRDLHARAAIAESRRRVLDRQQAALDALATAVATLAKSGETAVYDAVRQRLEADTHRRQLATATADARGLRAELEAWTALRFSLEEAELSGLVSSASTAVRPGSLHPRLRALDAAARADGVEERAARRRSVPDPQVFAGYRRLQVDTDVAHGLALGLTLPLTVFDSGAGQAARARADQLTTRAARAVEQRRLDARAQATRARLAALKAELARAPERQAAQQMRNGARQLYAAGEMSMTELLDAYEAAEGAELARLEILEQLATARIELMAVLGTQFDPELDRACSVASP